MLKVISYLCFVLVINLHLTSGLFKPCSKYVEQYTGDDVGEPLILTPLIEQNKIKEAQAAAKVVIDGAKNIKSYSGYLTVNKKFQSNTFFWFFPSKNNYNTDPVILWLQGGPGVSSLFGLFAEHGPFLVTDKIKLELRNVSWVNNHSVLYIDNPVGTGFSFTKNGYATEETQIGNELYIALLQFFKLFPELEKNDFYITGESYAGKYVPAIGYTILKNNPKSKLKINLQGMAIGNGFSDPATQIIYGDYLYELGLIDINQRDVYRKSEELETMAPHYKLSYFDFTGRAEPIRLILSYAEIPFEDNRISKEDWPKIKPTTPLEQLPIFEIDGQVFNQSIAICRYVAKEAKLTGNNDIENLKIDSSVDNLMDIHKKVIEYVFETDENKKKTLEEGLTQHVTKYLTKFEENAKKNGGFFAISRTSWADIMFLVEYEMLRNSLRKDVLADYPTLIKVKNQVLGNKGIRDWIKNRKEIKMFTFDLKQEL